MKIKLLLILAVQLILVSAVRAQYVRFPFNGVIEYDKSVNMYAILTRTYSTFNEGYIAQAIESYKKNNPQFKVSKSTLSFNKDKMLFSPIEDAVPSSSMFNLLQGQQINTVFTDLKNHTSLTQKNAYDETYLVSDSVRKIHWKLTTETREIAGYQCRRANGLMMDSVYVVAFYTDQIPISGGPESFNGLPGMILGVAIPHENMTWFATKVTDREVMAKEVALPTKGKPVDKKTFIDMLTKAKKIGPSMSKTYFNPILL